MDGPQVEAAKPLDLDRVHERWVGLAPPTQGMSLKDDIRHRPNTVAPTRRHDLSAHEAELLTFDPYANSTDDCVIGRCLCVSAEELDTTSHFHDGKVLLPHRIFEHPLELLG